MEAEQPVRLMVVSDRSESQVTRTLRNNVPVPYTTDAETLGRFSQSKTTVVEVVGFF